MRRRDLLRALGTGVAAPGALQALAAPAKPAAPSPFDGMTHVLMPGDSLAALLKLARDGDTIAVMPGNHRAQAGVVTQRQLTLRGIGARPVFEAAGAHAEGKALLVVRDGNVRIENLEFRGTRVSDGNGAGIRLERGRLEISRCAFLDNEMGVLTSNDGDVELRVQDCEFGQAPRGGSVLHHLLYAGRIARLEVRGCRMHNGWRGHLLKSRARQNIIESNLLVDGPGGECSYELEFAEGGLAWVVGNVIGQSEGSDNATLVSFASEGGNHPENGLFMAHNTLVNERRAGGTFVRVHEQKLKAPVAMRFINNLLVGRGETQTGAADWSAGNQRVELDALDAPALLQFGLARGSSLRGRGVPPGTMHGRSLMPATEFTLPVGTRPLAVRSAWTPGAFQ